MILLLIALSICGTVMAADADDAFEQGMRLARAGQWSEARDMFLKGRALAPKDKRFPLELAGVAFRTGDRAHAIKEFQHALALDPHDAYANEALGSLYLLDGNLDAAIVCLNRVDKPVIHDVVVQPELRRAVEASPGEVLTEDASLQTSANLQRLGYSSWRMWLTPRESGSFDLVVETADSAIAGRSVPGWALEIASGLPYQTLNLDFHPGYGWIETIGTTARWDPNKRLGDVRFSGVIAGNPRFRYSFDLNGRDEAWRVNGLAPFQFTGAATRAEIETGLTGRLTWTNGVVISNLDYRNTPAASIFANGLEVKGISKISYQAIRLPSKRLFVTLEGEAQPGSLVNNFSNFQAGARAHWTYGETYPLSVHGAVHLGTSVGQLPFNELFALGMSRDSDLWIRGHTAEYNGLKGNGPMGDRFALTKADFLQTVFRNDFLRWEAGPFLDTGKVSGRFGSHGWMVDTGVETHVQIMRALTFVAIYGRDTIHGGGAVFTAIRAGG